MIMPEQFVALAEQTELMAPFTARMLSESLTQCAAWQRAGLSLTVAVNVSARNLQDRDFPDHGRRRRSRSPASTPCSLELELTENALLVDRKRAVEVLQALRSTGIKIAIDDFGTGYSSLSNLRDLPVDHLKIDRSFVTDMMHRATPTLSIVTSTIELAAKLGIEIGRRRGRDRSGVQPARTTRLRPRAGLLDQGARVGERHHRLAAQLALGGRSGSASREPRHDHLHRARVRGAASSSRSAESSATSARSRCAARPSIIGAFVLQLVIVTIAPFAFPHAVASTIHLALLRPRDRVPLREPASAEPLDRGAGRRVQLRRDRGQRRHDARVAYRARGGRAYRSSHDGFDNSAAVDHAWPVVPRRHLLDPEVVARSRTSSASATCSCWSACAAMLAGICGCPRIPGSTGCSVGTVDATAIRRRGLSRQCCKRTTEGTRAPEADAGSRVQHAAASPSASSAIARKSRFCRRYSRHVVPSLANLRRRVRGEAPT